MEKSCQQKMQTSMGYHVNVLDIYNQASDSGAGLKHQTCHSIELFMMV